MATNDVLEEIGSFEQAWERTWAEGAAPPQWAAFIPEDPSVSWSRAETLDLARIDLSNRLRFGDRARVEDYFEPPTGQPGLREDPDAVLELIRTEFEYRLFVGEDPDPVEYARRFPDQVAPETLAELRDFRNRPDQDPHNPRFQLIRLHAQGAMGGVFEAFDRELKRRVAVKKLTPELAEVPHFRASFLNEAQTTASLEHPGVPAVYALDHDAGGCAFAMYFIRERPFREAVDNLHRSRPSWRNRTDPHGLLRRFITACQIVDHAHRRKVVHGDISVNNIMCGAHTEHETLVIDWGSPAVRGTPGFVSPELSGGGVAGPSDDIYSLGAVLYTVLVGKSPDRPSGQEDIRRPTEIEPRIPTELEAICLKALNPHSADRFDSARALAADVQAYLEDRPPLLLSFLDFRTPFALGSEEQAGGRHHDCARRPARPRCPRQQALGKRAA